MSTLDQVAAGIADPAKRKAFQQLYAPQQPVDLSTQVTAALSQAKAALSRLNQATKPPTLADKAERTLKALPGSGDGAGSKRTIPPRPAGDRSKRG